jgi:hypothetical protein
MSDEEVIQFPVSSIRQIAPTLVVDWDLDYRHSLRDRAWALAPYVWMSSSRRHVWIGARRTVSRRWRTLAPVAWRAVS